MAEGPGPRKKEERDYFFGRVIGEGSFSTVYLARYTALVIVQLLA